MYHVVKNKKFYHFLLIIIIVIRISLSINSVYAEVNIEFDEKIIMDNMQNIIPQEKIKSLKSCINVIEDPNKENCWPLIKECAEKCKNYISNDCLFVLINDDFSGWLKGDDSLFGLFVEKKIDKEIYNKVLKLKGLEIFEIKQVPEICIKQITNIPLCLYSISILDIKRWLNKEESILGKIIEAKLFEFYNFQSSEGYGKTKWGMSEKKVKKIYQKIKQNINGDFYVERSITGKKTITSFNFINDKLLLVEVSFKETHNNPDKFINDYQQIQELLKKKYGQPKNNPFSEEGQENSNL